MKIINSSNSSCIADRARAAKSFFTRLRGLLFTKRLSPGEGLLLYGCRAVHTFGMGYPIDIIFLSRQGVIVHLMENVEKNKVSPHVAAAFYVLELPGGQIKRTDSGLGDRLDILPD